MNSDNKPVDVKFGKKILYSLSTGMYENPFFIYREYVQNSADALDEAVANNLIQPKDARIEINIDCCSQEIIFYDNGIGISKENVIAYLVNIGDSKKDPTKQKGRFGIGRLGGLGYCDTLVFETSARGDNVKTIISWDAKELSVILASVDNDDDAVSVIQGITNIQTAPCDKEEHYFKVTLHRVSQQHKDLLNIECVRNYLSQVAPVPFDKSAFRHARDIYEFLEQNNLSLSEYTVDINGDAVYKCYGDIIKSIGADPSRTNKGKTKEIEVRGVVCDIIEDKNHLYGWFWVGKTDCDGALGKYTPERCIRLRQWNIQIGEATCLNSLWKEDRGNGYFIGEVHVLDLRLMPNARRDYFQIDENCRVLEAKLKEIFQNLDCVYRSGSTIHSSNKNIEKANQLENEYKKRISEGSFVDEEERESVFREMESAKQKASKSLKEKEKIESRFENAENNSTDSKNDVFNSFTKEMISDIWVSNPTPSPSEIPHANEQNVKQPVSFDVSQKTSPQVHEEEGTNSFWRSNDIVDKGEKRILTIVRKVLKEKLSGPDYKSCWNEIIHRMMNLEEGE